jgi:hypothetical protein
MVGDGIATDSEKANESPSVRVGFLLRQLPAGKLLPPRDGIGSSGWNPLWRLR